MDSFSGQDLPFHIHLEISSKCALACLRCPRTEFPDTPWIGKQLSLENIKKFIPESYLKKILKRITICGDVGDSIYNSEFHEIVEYFKKTNPSVHLYIITNGSHRPQSWWTKTASLLNQYDTVAFSVDGYDSKTNQQYRVGSNWTSIMQAIQEIDQSPAYMVWAMIVFKFNEDKINEMQTLARKLGFDYFQITKSTKFGSKYPRFNNEGTAMDPLEPSLDWISSSNRFERTVIRISDRDEINNSQFLKMSQDQTVNTEIAYKDSAIFPLCKNGNRGAYINVSGQLFPCSWVSFPFNFLLSEDRKRKVLFKDSYFHLNMEAFSLHNFSIEEILKSPAWNEISDRFKTPEKTFIECQQKCSKKFMDSNYQIGWNLN